MKKFTVFCFTLLLVFRFASIAKADADWEYWSHYKVVGSINDNLDFKVNAGPRYNENFSNHYFTYFEIGVDWKFKDRFILSPYYRHINKKEKSDWKVEYRPNLNAAFKWKLLGLNFTNRNRLEYRIKEDKKFFQYRNKLTVKPPKFTQFKIQPYVAEELFYDFDANELSNNRIYTGVDFKVAKNLKAGIDYMLESRKRKERCTNVNVLETSLKYNF